MISQVVEIFSGGKLTTFDRRNLTEAFDHFQKSQGKIDRFDRSIRKFLRAPRAHSQTQPSRHASLSYRLESSAPLGDSADGLELLRAYVRTKKGKSVAKYLPFAA